MTTTTTRATGQAGALPAAFPSADAPVRQCAPTAVRCVEPPQGRGHSARGSGAYAN